MLDPQRKADCQLASAAHEIVDMTVRAPQPSPEISRAELEAFEEGFELHASIISQIARKKQEVLSSNLGKDPSRPISHNVRMGRKTTKAAANHLRAWREMRGLTQAELGEKVGTSDNVISLLESGERGLSHKWLLKLAPALGTTPGFLLDHDPNDLDTAFLEDAMSVPKERRQEARLFFQALKTGTRS